MNKQLSLINNINIKLSVVNAEPSKKRVTVTLILYLKTVTSNAKFIQETCHTKICKEEYTQL